MLVSYTGTPAGRGGGCFLLSSACACSTDFSLYDNQKDRVPKSSRLTIFHKQGVYIIRRVGRKYMILRGNLVNRTYGKNKNLYISVFFTTIIGPVYYGPPYWQQLIRVILIREFVSHSFHIFFAQLFHLPDFPGLFFRKKWNLTSFWLFCFWRISRIVTERLRVLLHTGISNYFQTLGIPEKKNSPIGLSLRRSPKCTRS